MSKIQYLYIPLDKATIVSRRHPREVTPPGMINLQNALPSRSDASITIRPDWIFAPDEIYGMSGDLTLPGDIQIRDALNTATGLYGSDQITYFTSYIPYGTSGGYAQILSDVHGDGTVSLTADEPFCTGVGTTFMEKAYRGAIMRVLNSGTSYTGAPYLFIESPNDADEYYMTDLTESEVPLLGTYIRNIDTGTYRQGTAGSLDVTNSMGTGDTDALGFTALYTRLRGDGSTQESPADIVGDSGRFARLTMATNVSGSPNKWTASGGGGANEYYLTAIAGTVPLFVPDTAGDSSDVPFYARFSGISFSLMYPTVGRRLRGEFSASNDNRSNFGVVESLADYEWGIGDADALGFSTVYFATDTGDPDVVSYPISGSDAIPGYCMYLYYHKDISQAGSYTWTKSAIDDSRGNVYYLKLGAGSPFIDAPSWLWVNTIRYPLRVNPDDFGAYWSAHKIWGYGDSALDGLGYDTIYVRLDDSIVVSSADIRINGKQKYMFSNYSWAASANGTNEYHLAKQDGSDLAGAFDEPNKLFYDRLGNAREKGTVSSLTDRQWGYGSGAGDSTPNTIYYRSDDGDPDTLELELVAGYEFDLYASDYKWTESVAQGDEWHIGLIDPTDPNGTALDPSISSPTVVDIGEYTYTEGTAGSLAKDEWDYGDNDALGYNTIYIYSTSTPDGAVGTGSLDGTAPKKMVVRDSAADYDHYLVDKITSNSELSIFGNANSSTSGVVPRFYYNHNPFRSDHKINVQAYTSGLIYCSPSIADASNEEDISGPFYAGLQKGDWRYSQEIIKDKEFEGDGTDYTGQPQLAANGFSYVQVWPQFYNNNNPETSRGFIAHAYSITGTGSWTKRSSGGVLEYDGYLSINGSTVGTEPFLFNSIQSVGTTYICGGDFYSDDRPGIAYTTDNFGLVWIAKGDSAYEWASGGEILTTEYGGICAAWNGSSPGRIVALYWRRSDDRVVVRYTDDSGGTFNDTNIGGNTYISDGDKDATVQYIGEQFVINVADGVYYGDGTSFTKKAITGATEIKSIAYNGSNEWAAIESTDNKIWTCSTLTGTWTSTTLPKPASGDITWWLIYDTIGERWIVNSEVWSMWTDDLTVDPVRETPLWSLLSIYDIGEGGSTKSPTNMAQDSTGIVWSTYDGGADHFSHLRLSRFSYYWWDIDKFVPISPDYRSTTFSVLDGYVMLIGVSERDFDQIPTTASTETQDPGQNVSETIKDFTLTALSNLGSTGVVPGSVTIRATLTDSTTETITDDEAGTLKGNVSATGTISYDTGIIRIIFNNLTVDDGTTIKIDYKYYVDGPTLGWTRYPRRIRWTAPKTFDDFEGVGSGTGDANGEGLFLDSRPVNGRIVIFETNSISAVVPRGDVSDPWDFDAIREGISLLSNPVVVDDFCYFIASDGLIWRTNGITAEEVGSSFDATKYDDYTENKPITVDYSRALNALLIYYFDPNVASPDCSVVSLATGAVTKMELPVMSDSNSLAEEPATVLAIADSSDQRILVSHNPLDSDTDKVIVSSLTTGRGIFGTDKPVESGQDNYWYSTIETGELFVAPEGQKTSLHHLIVRTYSTAGDGDNTYRPYMAVEVKSLEDSAWKSNGDSVGTASMTTTALTGNGTAWSTLIAGPNAGSTQQKCDGAETDFTVAGEAKNYRFYLDSTLQSAYTTSGSTVAFASAPAATKTLYGYSENYPEVEVAVGDHFKSTEGFHRVSSIESAQDITLDHYLSTGSETVTHYACTQIPDGDEETKIGIRKLVEGVQVRLFVIPYFGTSANPSIVKITGLTIGHIPQGRKILTATGS